MRYVYLLLILCISFAALNTVNKYHSPLSFLSIGNTSPSNSIVYPSRHRFDTRALAANASALRGGPSQGFGLTASSPLASSTGLATASDAGVIGTASEVDLKGASMRSESVNKAHKEQITSISQASSSTASSAVVSALITQQTQTVNQAQAAVQVQTASQAQTTGNNQTVDDIDAPVAVESTDAAPMTLESSLSLDADFIDLAPMPDAVVVEPGFNTYNLSRQSFAFADSIRNSLMDPHGVQFGGIAGLNWSGAAATNTTGKVSGTPLTGFTLGLFADIPLKKQLSFRPELLYSYEGYQPVVSGEKVNIHVAYLNMPLDLVYRTSLLGKRFFVGGGPYLAYAFNGTYTMKGTNTDMQFGSNLTEGANLRNTDFGAHLMAGILLDRNFILGVSANLGLSNIAPTGTTTDIHTRSFGLSIGYVFRNRANTKTY